jgi:hypothetical protein
MRKSSRGYDNKRFIVWLGMALSAACGDTNQGSERLAGLSGAGQNQAAQCGEPGAVVLQLVEAQTLSLDDLDCPRGRESGPITVAFDCQEITVISCKDLSNVVVELADGSRQRFEGLSGHQAVFSATGARKGGEIVGVWVKAGANHSGDGPGYGQRFDAPAGTCDETDDPPGNPPSDDPPGEQDPPADDPPGEQDPPSDGPPGEQEPPGENDPPGEQEPPCVVNPPVGQVPPSQEPPRGEEGPIVVL